MSALNHEAVVDLRPRQHAAERDEHPPSHSTYTTIGYVLKLYTIT